MRVGQKVRWNDPAIADYPIEERETQSNRVYTIVKFISEEICLIADEFGEAEVPLGEIQDINISNFNRAYTDLKRGAIARLKEVGSMSFNHLYEEILDEDGEVEDTNDERPMVLVANRHCEISWYPVMSVRWDEERDDIMLDCDDYGEIPSIYCEACSEHYVFADILRN